MSRWVRQVGLAGAGYLLGTLPTADLVTRWAGGPDLRDSGSGNPGAANAANVLGPGFGLAVLAGDIAKGAAAGRLGSVAAGPTGGQVAAASAVVGHCFPVWSEFKGGKGVATSVGQVLSTFPAYFPFDLAVAVATSALPFWKQRAFAATSAASITWVIGSVIWWRRQLWNGWGPTPTAALPLGSAVSSAVIAYRFWAERRS